MDMDAAAKDHIKIEKIQPSRRCVCVLDSVLGSPCVASDCLGAIAGETYLDRFNLALLVPGGIFHTFVNLP